MKSKEQYFNPVPVIVLGMAFTLASLALSVTLLVNLF